MLLTATTRNGNLYMPLTHSRDGIEAPQLGQYRPLSTVVFLCPLKIINKGLLPVKSFMVDCIEQSLIGLAVPFCGSFNLIQSTAQRLKPMSGGLYSKKGHKPMNTHAKKLTLSVSEIKKQSLKKKLDIIDHALDIFCTESNQINVSTLKNDALELVRMLDDLSNDLSRTSLFNVLDKSKQLIAENVPFTETKQYQNCIVKFAGMEVIA